MFIIYTLSITRLLFSINNYLYPYTMGDVGNHLDILNSQLINIHNVLILIRLIIFIFLYVFPEIRKSKVLAYSILQAHFSNYFVHHILLLWSGK